jgi:hypothetical protein
MNTNFHALSKKDLIEVINQVFLENKELSLAVEVRDQKLLQAEQTIARERSTYSLVSPLPLWQSFRAAHSSFF